MNSWKANQIANLYNAVKTIVATTPDTLAKRLQCVRKTASL